ncbi:MAG: hypothetical protein LJE67_04475 [Salaquimonas sp.]|nr:hypothetical protein [Salaquimonas sp.]
MSDEAKNQAPPTPHPSAGMPNWLFWAIAGKLILVVAVVIAVLWYAGIVG